jgi:hypothetical protein
VEETTPDVGPVNPDDDYYQRPGDDEEEDYDDQDLFPDEGDGDALDDVGHFRTGEEHDDDDDNGAEEGPHHHAYHHHLQHYLDHDSEGNEQDDGDYDDDHDDDHDDDLPHEGNDEGFDDADVGDSEQNNNPENIFADGWTVNTRGAWVPDPSAATHRRVRVAVSSDDIVVDAGDRTVGLVPNGTEDGGEVPSRAMLSPPRAPLIVPHFADLLVAADDVFTSSSASLITTDNTEN